MTTTKCSSLCGADRAYGPRVRYWHHEFQCPRRQEMYEALKVAGGGSVSTDIDQKRDGTLSASPLSDGPTDQPSEHIGAEGSL